jgi:hypothetical protein
MESSDGASRAVTIIPETWNEVTRSISKVLVADRVSLWPTRIPKLPDEIRFEPEMRKPVIYLFPSSQVDVQVTVSLSPEWNFSSVYPVVPVKPLSSMGQQQVQWKVCASPDGILTEADTGLRVSYLFWEAMQVSIASLIAIQVKG